jgi:ATP adenylyltransferase/5',5'''-P-1,P-4-tetraphosphate phosphorylase II
LPKRASYKKDLFIGKVYKKYKLVYKKYKLVYKKYKLVYKKYKLVYNLWIV